MSNYPTTVNIDTCNVTDISSKINYRLLEVILENLIIPIDTYCGIFEALKSVGVTSKGNYPTAVNIDTFSVIDIF